MPVLVAFDVNLPVVLRLRLGRLDEGRWIAKVMSRPKTSPCLSGESHKV